MKVILISLHEKKNQEVLQVRKITEAHASMLKDSGGHCGVVAQAFNPSTWEADTVKSL